MWTLTCEPMENKRTWSLWLVKKGLSNDHTSDFCIAVLKIFFFFINCRLSWPGSRRERKIPRALSLLSTLPIEDKRAIHVRMYTEEGQVAPENILEPSMFKNVCLLSSGATEKPWLCRWENRSLNPIHGRKSSGAKLASHFDWQGVERMSSLLFRELG